MDDQEGTNSFRSESWLKELNYHESVCKSDPVMLECVERRKCGSAKKGEAIRFDHVAKRAVSALKDWATEGFKFSDADQYKFRVITCRSCPHSVKAREFHLTKNLPLIGEILVCKKCGCSISKKAKLFTEKCPSKDPANPTTSRWGGEIGHSFDSS
jgi:hypothetical protein